MPVFACVCLPLDRTRLCPPLGPAVGLVVPSFVFEKVPSRSETCNTLWKWARHSVVGGGRSISDRSISDRRSTVGLAPLPSLPPPAPLPSRRFRRALHALSCPVTRCGWVGVKSLSAPLATRSPVQRCACAAGAGGLAIVRQGSRASCLQKLAASRNCLLVSRRVRVSMPLLSLEV